MIDLYFRAFSRARWLAFAQNRNIILMVDGIEEIQPGFAVDEIGFFQLTDGPQPTYDTWWSVNLRIHGQKAVEDEDTVFTGEDGGTPWKFIRSKIVRFVREQATVISLPFRGDTVRAYQFGSGNNRIQLLDPRDITFPRRHWLGGMSL